jgi:hypothetical protein
MKKINQKMIKKKQITIKRMRIKLDINENELTPLYFGKEKREKKEEKKKNSPETNHCLFTYTHNTNRKIIARRFKDCLGMQHFGMGQHMCQQFF